MRWGFSEHLGDGGAQLLGVPHHDQLEGPSGGRDQHYWLAHL